MKEMRSLKETIRKNKIAAMEMTVGTIVTIVLLMSALVLGLILTQTIFKGSKENIESIDEGVKNQITTMFSKDELKQIVLYPGTSISVKKGGEDAGFAFSIRNLGNTPGTFSYTIAASSVQTGCTLSLVEANKYISLGGTGSGIQIAAGNIMSNPIMVKFAVPESAPPCTVRYNLNVYQAGSSGTYTFIQVDVKIISK